MAPHDERADVEMRAPKILDETNSSEKNDPQKDDEK
jgi:hypothetical protein